MAGIDKSINEMIKNGATTEDAMRELTKYIDQQVVEKKRNDAMAGIRAAIAGGKIDTVETSINKFDEVVISKLVIKGTDGKTYGINVNDYEDSVLYKKGVLTYTEVIVE